MVIYLFLLQRDEIADFVNIRWINKALVLKESSIFIPMKKAAGRFGLANYKSYLLLAGETPFGRFRPKAEKTESVLSSAQSEHRSAFSV